MCFTDEEVVIADKLIHAMTGVCNGISVDSEGMHIESLGIHIEKSFRQEALMGIAGPRACAALEFTITAEISIPATWHEPEDVQDIPLGTAGHITGAIETALVADFKNRVQQSVESVMWQCEVEGA